MIEISFVPIVVNTQTFTWQGCLGLQSGRWFHGSQHLRSTVKTTQELAVKLVTAECLELRDCKYSNSHKLVVNGIAQ